MAILSIEESKLTKWRKIWLPGVVLLMLSGWHIAAIADSHEVSVLDKTKSIIAESADTVATTSSQMWDATKSGSGAAWEKTKETSRAAADYSVEKGTQILDTSKAGVAKGAEVVATKSSQAWQATKDAGEKVVDYSVETYEKVKESVAGEDNSGPIVEDKSF